MEIIAEVKTHSPFGWESNKSWDELFAIAVEGGDMISIHTDPRWHGSFDLIEKARNMTDKPILAKGIHSSDDDVHEAIRRGASYVLVVGRLPQIHLDRCLIEPNTLEELAALPPHVRAVWNSRDLSTGAQKTATFQQARALFPGWLCQASNIANLIDIDPLASAVLIGTHLPELADQLQAKS